MACTSPTASTACNPKLFAALSLPDEISFEVARDLLQQGDGGFHPRHSVHGGMSFNANEQGAPVPGKEMRRRGIELKRAAQGQEAGQGKGAELQRVIQ